MNVLVYLFLFVTLSATGQPHFYGEYGKPVAKALQLHDKHDAKAFHLIPKLVSDGDALLGIEINIDNAHVCNGQNELYFLFRRGQRIILKSQYPINCNGQSYFPVNNRQRKYLEQHRLFRIVFRNGRNQHENGKRIVGIVNEADDTYFIELLYAVDNAFRFNNLK